jgi:hypothetical protein
MRDRIGPSTLYQQIDKAATGAKFFRPKRESLPALSRNLPHKNWQSLTINSTEVGNMQQRVLKSGASLNSIKRIHAKK